MSSQLPSAPLRQLRRAFQDGRLTLFLGAGCSVASGIPTWNQLVTSLYMNGVSRRLHNYQRVLEFVPSVTQWAFERDVVPLEVAARGLNIYYREDGRFVRMIQEMLYNWSGLVGRRPREMRKLLAKNKTLGSIAHGRRPLRGRDRSPDPFWRDRSDDCVTHTGRNHSANYPEPSLD
jgi:hypothetical protein